MQEKLTEKARDLLERKGICPEDEFDPNWKGPDKTGGV